MIETGLETRENILGILTKYSAKPINLNGSQNLTVDLGFDSLAVSEPLMDIESLYDIDLPEQLFSSAVTVEDIISAVTAAQLKKITDMAKV